MVGLTWLATWFEDLKCFNSAKLRKRVQKQNIIRTVKFPGIPAGITTVSDSWDSMALIDNVHRLNNSPFVPPYVAAASVVRVRAISEDREIFVVFGSTYRSSYPHTKCVKMIVLQLPIKRSINGSVEPNDKRKTFVGRLDPHPLGQQRFKFNNGFQLPIYELYYPLGKHCIWSVCTCVTDGPSIDRSPKLRDLLVYALDLTRSCLYRLSRPRP